MIKVSEEKKELIKKLNTSLDVYKILEDEIKEAVLNKTKLPLIKAALEHTLDKELSLESLKKFVAANKSKWIEEKRKEKIKKTKEKKEKKFILLANDKGGVGKTTLATLLDLPNSLILNLDKTREIAHIYPYKKIADFGVIEKMENIDLEYYLHLLKENEDIEYIIIDTKGGITEDLVKVLPYVDSIIIPIKVGSLSEEPSYGFIVELKAALDSLNSKNVKWAIVYNDVSPKFLKKVGIAKYELLDEFKEMEKALRDEVLGDDLKVVTYFKRSEAITTREKEKKDIDELMKKNFGAYLPIKNEINRLNKELENVIRFGETDKQNP